jgi:D-erythronate 2-dehydrogenase
MKLLITGGAGFLGARLARTLLAKGTLAGQKLTQVVLADQFPAPADLAADPRVQVLTGPVVGPMRRICEGQV